MSTPLDTSGFWKQVEGTEPVTFYAKTAESTLDDGHLVPNAKRRVLRKDSDAVGQQHVTWHLWRDQLGTVIPKKGDKLTSPKDGLTWLVGEVSVESLGNRYRLTTVLTTPPGSRQ